MSSINCPNCAELIDDPSLKFCFTCGTRLPERTPEVIASVPSFAPPAIITGPPVAAAPAEPEAPAAPPVVAEPAPAPVPEASAPTFDPAPSPNPAPAATADTSGFIVRRTRTSPFLPPTPVDADETPSVSRAWATAQGKKVKGQLGRQRRMAGDLPGWEPLPPGELLVKRGGQ
jgi:hypothetical protein